MTVRDVFIFILGTYFEPINEKDSWPQWFLPGGMGRDGAVIRADSMISCEPATVVRNGVCMGFPVKNPPRLCVRGAGHATLNPSLLGLLLSVPLRSLAVQSKPRDGPWAAACLGWDRVREGWRGSPAPLCQARLGLEHDVGM